MAELNLKQITDKLNTQLNGDTRKLVFWYDDNGEFAEDIDSLELDNARVLRLERDNQFYIKHFLECVDTTTHYLVYAPFPKPDIYENHLEDTVRYSMQFYADRASLIALDLGYNDELKEVIQKYHKFFESKERTQKYYDLELEALFPYDIEIGIMCVLCKLKSANYEELIRKTMIDESLLAELEKYSLTQAFWHLAETHFGYSDDMPSIEKFTMMLFVMYFLKTTSCDTPDQWAAFATSRAANNIKVFLDNMMNNSVYGKCFDEISERIYRNLDAEKIIRSMQPSAIADCCLFKGIDEILIEWMTGRIENEDVAAKLNGKSISEICRQRRKTHFGSLFTSHYYVIENALFLLSYGSYEPISGVNNIIRKYREEVYQIDRRYRYFYYHYDKIENNERFEHLRQLVENVYTNNYLNTICVNWNKEFTAAAGQTYLPCQIDFYNRYVRPAKERVVVIISDALRYEVGCTLFEKLNADEKCTVKIDMMQSVLPSYTRLGMAALLPHRSLEMTESFEVLVDGKSCDDTLHREPILKEYNRSSRCVQYDEIIRVLNNKRQLREIFTKQEVVYVYHNQIDARGDKLNTENEVFVACEEAVDEIFSLIKRLTTSANTIHFIVTADHGFIYKRDRIAESDKIAGIAVKPICKTKRYIVADEPIEAVGVESLPLSGVLRNNDTKFVSFPLASDIFKAPGGGMNFVHGGSSPQEMLVPVIDVRTQKSHKETTNAVISLVSLSNKITNLVFSLNFIQNEPVGNTVKETTYRIVFVDDKGEKISNEIIHTADNKSTDAADRVFRLRFNLKNRQYNRRDKFYMTITDDKSNLEIYRQEVIIDIAFADDFGF